MFSLRTHYKTILHSGRAAAVRQHGHGTGPQAGMDQAIPDWSATSAMLCIDGL